MQDKTVMTVLVNNVSIDPAGLKTWIYIDETGLIPENKINVPVPAGELLSFIYEDDRNFFSEQLIQGAWLEKKQEGIVRIGPEETTFLRYEINPLGKSKTVLIRFSVIRNKTGPNKNLLPAEVYAAAGSLSLGVFFTDEAGNYLYANPVWIKLTGHTPETFQSTGCWLDDVVEEDKEWALNLWQLALKNKLSFDYELRLKNKKGNAAGWIMVNSFFLTDLAGQLHFGAIATDIGEKKKNEAEIDSAHRNFESIFNLIQEAFLIVDHNRQIVDCNKKFLELLGYESVEELAGRSTECLYPSTEYYHEIWYTLNVPVLKEGKYSGVIQMKKKDGTIFPASISSSRLSGEGDHSFTFATAVTDGSVQKAQELSARQIEVRLSELNKAIDHALLVSITDRHGVITYVNEAFAEAFGYTVNEIIGKSHRVLNSGFHPKSFFTNLWNTILSGQTWKGIIRNKVKDGSYHWSDTAIIPQFDENSNIRHFIALSYDISRFFKTKYKSIVDAGNEHLLSPFEMLLGASLAISNENAKPKQEDMKKAAEDLTAGILLLQRPVFLFVKEKTSGYVMKDLNSEAEKMLSVERGEIIGKNTAEIKNIVCDALMTGITSFIDTNGGSQETTIHFDTALWEAWYETEIIHHSEKEFAVVLTDVSERVRNEKRLGKRTKHVELLLREFKHRLKNNLQLFISLSAIHRHKHGHGESEILLINAENRAKTIALLHEWIEKEKDAEDIRIDHYTAELVRLIVHTYTTDGIDIRTDIGPLRLGITTAFNYGIILNELITNCYKHAFSKERKVVIGISLRKADNDILVLTVNDNGPGHENVHEENRKQAGWEIIRQLAHDMKGEMIIENGANGFLVTVMFKDVKL